MITEEMIRSGRKTALGGIVCTERIVEDSVSTIYLHSAIRMEREDFIEGEKGERNYYRLKTFFTQLETRMSAVFSFEKASYVEDYGIFTFSAPEGWTCLADLQLPLSGEMSLKIFKSLLEFINTYRQCDMNLGGYKPMLFICPESVYIKFDDENNLKEVRLLPMPYDKEVMYSGMPHEVLQKKANLSSDVSMAAYLYLLLKYTNEQSFDETLFTKCDYLAELCLSPFEMRRPSLSRMLTSVDSDEPVDNKPADDNNYIVVIDDTVPATAKKQKRSSFFGIKKKKKSKKAGKISNLSKAKDKFDDMLSTEEADNNEE